MRAQLLTGNSPVEEMRPAVVVRMGRNCDRGPGIRTWLRRYYVSHNFKSQSSDARGPAEVESKAHAVQQARKRPELITRELPSLVAGNCLTFEEESSAM